MPPTPLAGGPATGSSPQLPSAPWITSAILPALLPAFLALLALPSASPGQKPHCGTSQWMERKLESRHVLKRAGTAAARAAAHPVRTLETDHFMIRYMVRGNNRARTGSTDAALVALVDSLYASLPGTLSDISADSAVHARLDQRGAPHPAYISSLADLLEKAYGYYVDTLGMKAPKESIRSVYYQAPAHPAGKYPVDVADIGTADPDFRGQEIYALTYPTGFGGMLMENDFLFNAAAGPDGVPDGDSISSRYQGRLVHNYADEWLLGLKVTVYHELYHSVQFQYTPDEESFHLWYETSATGMEERKAPEVNDYLQYLPAYMDDLSRRGMRAFASGSLSRYGNGVYHLFLTRELGEDFDVKVWTRLAANRNDIWAALDFVYASYGRNSHEVYARYAAQLAFSGTDAANPLPAFTSDLPLWPRLPRDTVDLARASAYSTPALAPLAIRGLALIGSGTSGKALFQTDTLVRAALARLRPDSSRVEILKGPIIPLDIPGEGGEALAVLSNGHHLRVADPLEVRPLSSRVDTSVYPYPNPLDRAVAGGYLLFSRLDRPAVVTLYTERGSPMRVLAFNSDANLWSWDLVDARGRKVRPGLYWYRVDGGALRPFYVK